MSAGESQPPDRVSVLRIIARLNVGGPAWHVVLLSEGTRARYPTLLAIGAVGPDERDMSAFATERGITPVRVPGLGREHGLWRDVQAFVALWRLCRRHRPTIVHTHTAKAGAIGRIAALLAGVPVRVHTFHGHVFRGYFGRLRTALYVLVERVLARFTTMVVAISPRQATELRGHLRLTPERVRIVPLGIDLTRFARDDARAGERFRTDVGATPEQTVVTMVGRLTAIKNHALALRALARANAPGVLLVLVGGGEEEASLRVLARDLGLEARVRFAGWRDDLEAVYYGTDVVALTSINEGTPVCLIEALACGRPVVATDVGGVADVLADGELGVLVPSGDVAALARAFERLADPGARAATAGRGREVVLARYSHTRLVADTEALYDELVAAMSAR